MRCHVDLIFQFDTRVEMRELEKIKRHLDLKREICWIWEWRKEFLVQLR